MKNFTRKNICVVLILAMLLMVVGCASDTTVTPSIPPVSTTETIIPTEEVAPEMDIIEPPAEPVAEYSLLDGPAVDDILGTTSASKTGSWKACTDFLRERGFLELGSWELTSSQVWDASVVYADNAFRMEFSFRNFSGEGPTKAVIYGTTHTEPANISYINLSDYDKVFEEVAWADSEKVAHLDICPQYFEYKLANQSGETTWPASDWGLGTNWAWGDLRGDAPVSELVHFMGIYSPGTQNLYNIVFEYDQLNHYDFTTPHFLLFETPRVIVENVWKNTDLKYFGLVYPDNDYSSLNFGSYMFLTEGMNFAEWSESEYNLDKWEFIDHGGYGELRIQDKYSLLINYTLGADGTVTMDTMDVFLSPGDLTMISVLPAM